MKKIVLTLAFLLSLTLGVSAQRFVLIDSEYILSNIPEYEQANKKIEQQTSNWNKQIQSLQTEIRNLYLNYQKQQDKVSAVEKQRLEDQIIQKEKNLEEVKKSLFGPEGQLQKLRQSLIEPFHENIYEASKQIAEQNDIHLVIDRATASSIIFASPLIDISNEVLLLLGYSK